MGAIAVVAAVTDFILLLRVLLLLSTDINVDPNGGKLWSWDASSNRKRSHNSSR